MVAGLPNSTSRILCLLLLFSVISLVPVTSYAQIDVSEPHSTDPTYEVVDYIVNMENLSDVDKVVLFQSFEAAIGTRLITPDQALELAVNAGLDEVSIGEDTTSARVESLMESLSLALASTSNLRTTVAVGSSSGTSNVLTSPTEATSNAAEVKTDESIADSSRNISVDQSSEAVNKALSTLVDNSDFDVETTESNLANELDNLLDAGVPPGILVRILRDSSRLDLEASAVEDRLVELQKLVDSDVALGRAANEVTKELSNSESNTVNEDEQMITPDPHPGNAVRSQNTHENQHRNTVKHSHQNQETVNAPTSQDLKTEDDKNEENNPGRGSAKSNNTHPQSATLPVNHIETDDDGDEIDREADKPNGDHENNGHGNKKGKHGKQD